jgi:exonuclease III
MKINRREEHIYWSVSIYTAQQNRTLHIYQVKKKKKRKRHRLTEWVKNQDLSFCCIQETHFSNEDRGYLRVKGWKKVIQLNRPKKQAGIAILISYKINIQPKLSKRDREGHFILIKGKIYQDEISILNI